MSQIIKVKRGVREFKIPAIELSISVWALVKRKAGMPFPMNPTISKGKRFFLWINLIRRIKKGVNKRKVKNKRKEAT